MEGCNLPEDMLAEILLRLPVKSLVRFRCVCKSWYQIIGTTSFVNSQKDITPNTNNRYFLCVHPAFYSLYGREELTKYRKYYYKPELFGINHRLRVYGSCEGLLCVSDYQLRVYSVIYLFNPIIRKAKTIPNVPFDHVVDDLCFGYFGNDYKVIIIDLITGVYHLGIYSFTTDSWKKITYGRTDSKDDACKFPFSKSSKFVNGVAYFVKYHGKIVCFDLYHETIKEVKFPENFGHPYYYKNFDMDAYQESIALVEIKDGPLFSMWILRNCEWEMKVRICLETAPDCLLMGFLNNDTYLLSHKDPRSGYFYTFNLENSELKELISEGEPKVLCGIESFVANLVLLNERSICPVVDTETEPYLSRTAFILNASCGKYDTAWNEDEKETSRKRRNNVQQQERSRKRRIEMEKNTLSMILCKNL